MRTLLRYELKKIMIRKISLISMFLGLLMIIISDVALIHNDTLSLSESEHFSGLDAVKLQTEKENALTNELSEEFLTDFLLEYQENLRGKDTELDYYRIAPEENLYALIASNFTEWNDDWNWEDLAKIDTKDGINFYDRRVEKIRTLLYADYSFGNYSEAERTYWMNRAENVQSPFPWGSRESWNIVWDSVCMLIYQVFVLSICIAPVFSEEFSYRTDALILSSKAGRTTLICAKIAAAFLFSLVYMMICGTVAAGLNIALLGTSGWNLPVQLWNTIIPYQLNALQASVCNLLVVILLAMALTAVSLMLSAICKKQIAVLAADVILFFGTVFLNSSRRSGIWNHIVCLMPMHVFDFRTVLKTYIDYQFTENIIVPYPMMIVIAYIGITVVCTCIAGFTFRRCQVGK